MGRKFSPFKSLEDGSLTKVLGSPYYSEIPSVELVSGAHPGGRGWHAGDANHCHPICGVSAVSRG